MVSEKWIFSKRLFLDWEDYDIDNEQNYNRDRKIINFYVNLFKDRNVRIVNEYPQKIYTQKLYYRIKNVILRNLIKNKENHNNVDLESYLKTCNTYAGKSYSKSSF